MRRVSLGQLMLTRRSLAAGAISLACASIASPAIFAAAEISMDQFRNEVVDVLRRNRPNLSLELSEDPASLTVNNGELYLGNLYQTVAGAGRQQRETRILQFIDAMVAALGDTNAGSFETAKARLRARIISAATVNQGSNAKMTMLTRPLSEQARIAYVIDSPRSMQFVSEQTLAKWGVTTDAVHAAGVANLDDISRDLPIETRAPNSGTGLYTAIHGADGYAAARLLAPRFMERMGEQLGPEFFASPPLRDLLLAWSVDCSVRQQLAALATHYASTRAYRVTDEIFVWSSDGLRLANAAERADHGRG
jgi:uncharacterized protein YtpQ (UPF0354 family)